MHDLNVRLLKLIVMRLGLVLLALPLARYTLPVGSPRASILIPLTLAVGIISALYLVLWKYAGWLRRQVLLQVWLDFILVTILLYFSGGISSIFTPFYVLIIVYASIFRGHRGGFLALALSLVSYLGVVAWGYLGELPFADEPMTLGQVFSQISVNLMAFVSVAFLGAYLSDRLRTAHQELGAARILQDNIIDSLRSGLMTLDLRGNITFFNRVGADIVGRSAESLIGTSLSEILPQSITEQILAEDFRTTRSALRLEAWVENSGAERRYLGLGCSPLLQHNRRIGYIVSFQDLTEIKQREDEMQFREKMAAIGEMAAGLAHELRNPLAALSGSIQILKSELELGPAQDRLLGIVLRESERLNRTVENFLAFARPTPISSETVRLAPLIKDTVQLLRNSPEYADGHKIVFEEDESDLSCQGNADQLRQVIWNILKNGLSAMSSGGTLKIQLGRRQANLLLRFKDEGMGMTTEQKAKLFEPFQSGFKKGSGLGMAIVYQIIRQHDGQIEVTSEPGRGTQIDILLPI